MAKTSTGIFWLFMGGLVVWVLKRADGTSTILDSRTAAMGDPIGELTSADAANLRVEAPLLHRIVSWIEPGTNSYAWPVTDKWTMEDLHLQGWVTGTWFLYDANGAFHDQFTGTAAELVKILQTASWNAGWGGWALLHSL